MTPRFQIGLTSLATALMLTACAPAPATPTSDQQKPPPVSGFKRMTAAIRGVPVSLVQQRTSRAGASIRGLDGVEELAHAGLSYVTADRARAAQLAEAVPSIENGLWRLLTDGRMEMTWKIRPGARWHDGTPLTSDDLLFTAAVDRDKELEIPLPAGYDFIEDLVAPDARTIVVTWKRPYIDADVMFSYGPGVLPLPKHLLERAYNEDKSNFLGIPYWNEEFVGLGAFRIREWVRDSHTILRANDAYIFGRPKIDEIEVRFIQDNNTLVANILAGTDLTLGKTISLAIALQVRDQWQEGRMAVMPQNWTPLNPQFINPDPAIIANFQFRRALLVALDRQELADLIFSGQGSIAHSYADPTIPLYSLVEPSIVKYSYDVRLAGQLIDGLGYTKRADGQYHDSAGQRLGVSIYTPTQNDIHLKTTAAVASYWQQIGVDVEQVPIPPQRMEDREWRTQAGGFQITERRNSLTTSEIWRFHSSQVPLPENRFRASGFESRYRHAEVDAALERYTTTIPPAERMQALGALMRHQTENLSYLPLFFGADPTLISNRLINVTARGDTFTQAWNVQEWDIRN